MDVVTHVVARAQPLELMEQRLRLLGHITHGPQSAAVGHAAPGEIGDDAAATQLDAVRLAVVSAVGVERSGAAERPAHPATHRRHRVHQRQELRHIVAVSPGERGGQRRAPRIGEHVVLRAVLAAVHGAGACFFPPRTARTDAESAVARDQSIRPAWWSLVSMTACSVFHTPAFRQALRRFHRVIPQQPISWGKSSQAMPVLSTKRMPVRHSRSLLGGWPPWGDASCLGSKGSTTDHNSSVTIGLDMTASSMTRGQDVPGTSIIGWPSYRVQFF